MYIPGFTSTENFPFSSVIPPKILSGILLCSNDIVAYSSGSEVSESVTIPETLKIILAKFARCSEVYSCENVYEVKVNKKNK